MVLGQTPGGHHRTTTVVLVRWAEAQWDIILEWDLRWVRLRMVVVRRRRWVNAVRLLPVTATTLREIREWVPLGHRDREGRVDTKTIEVRHHLGRVALRPQEPGEVHHLISRHHHLSIENLSLRGQQVCNDEMTPFLAHRRVRVV